MEDGCEAKSLEEKLGPTVIFNLPVEYLTASLHCVSFKYDEQGQLHLAYKDVATVFIDGKLKWQNHDYPTTQPVQAESAELVLAPDLIYRGKRSETLRFGRESQTKKESLKIVASQVMAVYQDGEQRWP